MTTATAEAFDPQLLRALRAAPWKSIERRFLIILAISIGVHIAAATYVSAQPMPVAPEGELTQEFNPERHALPPLHPIPKIPNLPVEPARPSVTVRPAPSTGVDKAKLAKVGLLGVMNGLGPSTGIESLVNDGSTSIAEALKDARIEINAGPQVTAKGARTGETVTVGELGTDGVKKVALAPHTQARPLPADGPMTIESTTSDIDPRVLQQFIAARRAAMQSCYERALLHNPSLQGKVVLRMAIGAGGRVSDLDIEEDTVGSEAVTACMSTMVKRWVFPVSPKEAIPVSVPFIFARSN
jgi:hypothetical protein